jgi:hypothetical protein
LWRTHRGEPVIWSALVARSMIDWYTCAIFTPFFFWLARRFPIDRRRWRSGIPAHLVGSSAAVVLKYAMLVAFWRRIGGDPSVTLARALAANFFIELMIFWAVIGVIHAIVFYQRWQEREQLAAELRVRLTEARLEVLQGQLRPHFLFNTLNSISMLVHSDPAGADRMVIQLGDLLRASLESSGSHEIPLADELHLLERYLGIMQVRHHDRLRVEMRIAPSTRAALVPHFVLQPLVENAIEHGIARRAGDGHIVIEACDEGDDLLLRVFDDGPGIDDRGDGTGVPTDEGVGLGNTRLRLRQLYGDAQSFVIERPPSGGARERSTTSRDGTRETPSAWSARYTPSWQSGSSAPTPKAGGAASACRARSR